MEDTGNDGGGIESDRGEDASDGDGVEDVGVSGEAVLSFVGVGGELVGLAHLLFVGAGCVFPELLEESVELGAHGPSLVRWALPGVLLVF